MIIRSCFLPFTTAVFYLVLLESFEHSGKKQDLTLIFLDPNLPNLL